MFFKIGVLKNFSNFAEKAPVLESFFNKVVRKEPLLNRNSNTGVFQWILRDFQKCLLCGTPPVDTSDDNKTENVW